MRRSFEKAYDWEDQTTKLDDLDDDSEVDELEREQDIAMKYISKWKEMPMVKQLMFLF